MKKRLVLGPASYLAAAVHFAAMATGCSPAPSAASAHDGQLAEAPSASVSQPAPPRDPAALAAAKHEKRVAASLARVPRIAEKVAQIRDLPLKHAVPAEIQSQDAFRGYLEAQVKKELPVEKSAQSVKALVRLGFLKQAIDLGKTIEDAMVSQAGAYYDPETKKFYLVLIPDDESMLDVMSAHELTHALDDQYFDLGAYTGDAQHPLTNDEQQARRFVGEGEATLVMLAYQAQTAAQQDIFDPKNRRIEQAMVSTFATLDSDELAKSAAENPAMVSQMGPGMKASMDAMSSIPPLILDPLFSAYTKGCAAVAAVRDAGGWPAVSALYTTPPESTEQLLHPETKLIGKRDRPVAITFAPLPKLFAGQTPLDTDVIGELTMAVYFKNWGDKKPTAEVTGWGGDRYAAYLVGDHVVGVWLTTWDTAEDAERFTKGYDATLAVRFPGEPRWSSKGERGVAHPGGTVTSFVHAGKDVAIVDGAPVASAPALFDWLAKSKRTK